MTKEEYLKRRERLQAELIRLREVYIHENVAFKKGDRVKVTLHGGATQIGSYSHAKVGYTGEISHIVNKLKNNGEAGKLKFYEWNIESIEPA